MLLLVTGSIDGTSDLLVKKLGAENVFRFNYDLYRDYGLEFTPHSWRIVNPAGLSIDSCSVTSAFWWKAFNYYLLDEEKFIVEEVKYIFREIYHWCRLRGIVKGNPHDFHNHMGKMNILSIASKHFKIPATLTTFRLLGIEGLNDKNIVAKSFSSGLTTTNKALMTTAVESSTLHPNYPWYLQERVDSAEDVTVFICGNNLFAYSRDRSKLVGLDWRLEQSFDRDLKEWFRFFLSDTETEQTKKFCKELQVTWGRIDLMRSNDGELIFLEFNANGQWVFLDYQQHDGLIDCVANYISAA